MAILLYRSEYAGMIDNSTDLAELAYASDRYVLPRSAGTNYHLYVYDQSIAGISIYVYLLGFVSHRPHRKHNKIYRRRPGKSMVPKKNGSIVHDHHGFPFLEVMILVLCATVYVYTVVNLIPYVGIMVMQLLGLASINEAGETRARETEFK